MLWQHLNFCQISHRFTSSFVNPSFQYLNGSHIMYWNMITLNPSRFKVQPHSKYWYFCIERWDLLLVLFLENAVLFHIEWVCQKTMGNVNRPPYRYTAVTHWACPPLSGTSKWNIYSLCDKPYLKITLKVCALENSHSPCCTLFQNLPQGENGFIIE